MPVSERAKQFMPFAALKGLPEALAQVEQAHTATAKKAAVAYYMQAGFSEEALPKVMHDNAAVFLGLMD